MEREGYLQFGNGHQFDPHPNFVNHMCHWAPWAEHYRDSWGGKGTLANMLGHALKEIDRLCKRGVRTGKAHSILLWAWIDLVETGEPKPLADDGPLPMPDAFAAIQLINLWRRENKLNIRLVDIS